VGASSWHYTVDYQPDVGAALEQLRQDVYARGEYYRESSGTDPDPDLGLTEAEFRAGLDPRHDTDGLNEAILDDWRERKRRPVPVDPDTLLAAQPHSGTHSIIDIYAGVSAAPGIGTVAPLTSDELVGFFRTTAPTPELVQEWMKRGDAGRERWVGTYIVSYADGQPAHLHFCGFSGD
jgi:hypothetical protein